jgi:hypothetical protein
LVKEMPSGRLEKVGIVETRDNYFEYTGTCLEPDVSALIRTQL